MSTPNLTNKAVNCPIHGTHGNLSHGSCWYCVQAGISSAPAGDRVITRVQVNSSPTSRVPGTVRIIL